MNDDYKQTKKTSWAELGHTRDHLMVCPSVLFKSFLLSSSHPFLLSFFPLFLLPSFPSSLFSFFPLFLLSSVPSFLFSFFPLFLFSSFQNIKQDAKNPRWTRYTVGGWPGGRFSEIIMPSLAFPTGLSSSPSVATMKML